jgi:hypothetical protein
VDFHLFAKLFFRKGVLGKDEFALCERLCYFLRQELVKPELVMCLFALVDVLLARKLARCRDLDVVTAREDLI